MLRNHYIKKNGLFLKRETVMYESDYWQVEEIDAEYKTRYTWTKNQEEAICFSYRQDAIRFFNKVRKQPFFKDDEISSK